MYKNLQLIIITCNIPNKNITNLIIKNILNKKLASCINIINNVESYYLWKNKLKQNKEIKIIIKTFLYLEKEIIKIIKKLHTYKIPEIITLKSTNINKKYLNWMKEQIKLPR